MSSTWPQWEGKSPFNRQKHGAEPRLWGCQENTAAAQISIQVIVMMISVGLVIITGAVNWSRNMVAAGSLQSQIQMHALMV